MRLRLTSRAAHDLIEIAQRVRERNPPAALKLREAILATMQTLVLFPEVGRRQSIEGVRKATTRRYPYLIYYTLDREADEIIVITIRHAARRREYQDT